MSNVNRQRPFPLFHQNREHKGGIIPSCAFDPPTLRSSISRWLFRGLTQRLISVPFVENMDVESGKSISRRTIAASVLTQKVHTSVYGHFKSASYRITGGFSISCYRAWRYWMYELISCSREKFYNLFINNYKKDFNQSNDLHHFRWLPRHLSNSWLVCYRAWRYWMYKLISCPREKF